MSILSDNIKKYRDAAGLTQEQVSKAVGKSDNVTSNWEAGRNKPNVDEVLILCKLFGVDANTLLGWNDSNQVKDDARKLASKIINIKDISEILPAINNLKKQELEMLKIFLKGFDKKEV